MWFTFKSVISLFIGYSSLLKFKLGFYLLEHSKQLFYNMFLIIPILEVSIVMSLLSVISSGYHSWFLVSSHDLVIFAGHFCSYLKSRVRLSFSRENVCLFFQTIRGTNSSESLFFISVQNT